MHVYSLCARRLSELTMANEKLKVQLVDKDRSIQTLQVLRGGAPGPVPVPTADASALSSGVASRVPSAVPSAGAPPSDDATRLIFEETEAMHRALRDIAQTVMADSETASALFESELAKELEPAGAANGAAQRSRSRSPVRSLSPLHTLGTLLVVVPVAQSLSID